MSKAIKRMQEIADNLLEIPANEQGIGHLQMAVQDFMQQVVTEFKAINAYLEDHQ